MSGDGAWAAGRSGGKVGVAEAEAGEVGGEIDGSNIVYDARVG